MQNLITSGQMKDADNFTIENLKISSIDLMESAAKAFVKVFKKEIPDKNLEIAILCGKGNNGGDGLAIARLLLKAKYKNIKVYLVNFSDKESPDFSINLKRLSKKDIPINKINTVQDINFNAELFIDAVLGAGLNKPLSGDYQLLGAKINNCGKKVIAVDVPTGFAGDGPLIEPFNGIKADLVICFQRPKINFFFPESLLALDRFEVVNIGLSEEFIEGQNSEWKLTSTEYFRSSLKTRKKFSHKGTYGHALLIAGNDATMGAAILCAKGCLLTGAGLTTVCVPKSGFTAINTALPEVMTLSRDEYFEPQSLEKYGIIAIGPGFGVTEENEKILEQLVIEKRALVVDADGLNLLSKRKDLLDQLAPGSVLTPHMKEFDRLFGPHNNWRERVKTAQSESVNRNIVIILKSQYTFIGVPTGEIWINPTGNPAMASGGMGDVLTGMITSLIAQSYSSEKAAQLAVYLHGKTGDELAKDFDVVIASKLAGHIPNTLRKLRNSE